MSYLCQPSQPTTPAGFTLIEVLVVTSLTVMLLLSSTALFLTFLLGNAKTNLAQQIKREGDSALTKIDYYIRNAQRVSGPCTTNMLELQLANVNGGQVSIYRQDRTDGSGMYDLLLTVDGTSSALNSSLTSAYSLNFACYENQGVQYVQTTFGLNRSVSNRAFDNEAETFTSGVLIRNRNN